MRWFFADRVVRNAICTFLLIAILAAMGHELWALAAWSDYRHSPSGFLIVMAVCAAIFLVTGLIALLVDARARQRRG